MNDPSERKCVRFVPRKKVQPCDYRISDHAVEQYVERFCKKGKGTENGVVRSIIKSVLEKGELIMHDGNGNEVIHKDGIFAVVTDSEVKTVYTRHIFVKARHRIIRGWERKGGLGNGEAQQIFEE